MYCRLLHILLLSLDHSEIQNGTATVILSRLGCNRQYHIIARALLMNGSQEGPALFDDDTVPTGPCITDDNDDGDGDGGKCYHM